MQVEKRILYCPSSSSVPSCPFSSNGGMNQPLKEIPITNNKGMIGWCLECPHCNTSVQMCESCTNLFEISLEWKGSTLSSSFFGKEDRSPSSSSPHSKVTNCSSSKKRKSSFNPSQQSLTHQRNQGKENSSQQSEEESNIKKQRKLEEESIKEVVPSSAESTNHNESRMDLEVTHDVLFRVLDESEGTMDDRIGNQSKIEGEDHSHSSQYSQHSNRKSQGTPTKDTSGEREVLSPHSNASPWSSPLERIQPAGVVAEVSPSSNLWTVCKRCGSTNLRDNLLRSMLNLDPIWPVPWDQMRIIQKQISNSLYISSKKNEFDQLKKIDTDQKSKNLNLIQQQIESLSMNSVQRDDLLVLDSLSSTKRIREGFKSSHLRMLSSLYNEPRNEDVFEDCKLFLKELVEISQIKGEMEVAFRVCQRSKRINANHETLNNTTGVIGNILNSRYNHLKKSFDAKIIPHRSLQIKVQNELKSLYEELDHLRCSKSNPSLTHKEDLNSCREFDEKLSILQSKIALWRLLSKTIVALLF